MILFLPAALYEGKKDPKMWLRLIIAKTAYCFGVNCEVGGRECVRERERDQNMVLDLLRYHHRDK